MTLHFVDPAIPAGETVLTRTYATTIVDDINLLARNTSLVAVNTVVHGIGEPGFEGIPLGAGKLLTVQYGRVITIDVPQTGTYELEVGADGIPYWVEVPDAMPPPPPPPPPPPVDSVTVALTGLQEFTNYIRWPDNVSLGSIFAADGTEQTLNFVDLNNNSPAGRVSLAIVGFNRRFTTAFEATGRIIFEASDGEMLEVMIADADMTETYAWTPPNAAEVVAFVAHVRGLSDQSATLTLSE